MQLSVRVDQQLLAQLKAIADAEDISLSEALRRAITRYVEESNDSLSLRLSDIIGSVDSSGGRANKSGEAFKRLQRRTK